MATNNEAILEEIEALQAIMLDEVKVLYGDGGVPNGVEVVVVPATAQNIEEQHVRVTLVLLLPPEYPDTTPSILLRNPRGVDDYVLEKIKQESRQRCEEYLGCPVIYELIEVVRENLTANNTPSCPCAICLHHFTDSDVFTKTPCFHYFHSYCLGRYKTNCEEEAAAEEEEPQPAWMAREKKQLMCPVCRDPIQTELNSTDLLLAPPPEEEEGVEDFRADSPELLALQQRMADLYLQQKEKGGIIDLEEEKNKFLLSSNRADSCEGLEEGVEDVARINIPDSPVEPRQEEPTIPPPSRRGGRSSHHRSQGQKSQGGYGRQHWRNMDQGGDGRYWSGNRGGRGVSGSRGRGGNSRFVYHNSSRIISEPQEYSSADYKTTCVIDNGYGTKGHGKREGNSHENGSIYTSGDNRARGNEVGNGAGGVCRKGPKGSGNRQRYGPGRGRGRGPPPPGFAPSSFRHSAQDWS
ncbi:E3 ubiquitin-protein ligase RNF25-like [Homarus americanus]|uniref:E3 ubiquitin-protein ligase RNF25-like n=1 Tax=Homarus americanus TaxID=6706 RepID=A0A8J5JC60_HOMAM|nr:E3 ubiquitin-protein ligase RNF25-like [Homarus americanus]KAG7154454.1 E3 ubiquitin-protein ligase RNF25-like [Homarus americanus]